MFQEYCRLEIIAIAINEKNSCAAGFFTEKLLLGSRKSTPPRSGFLDEFWRHTKSRRVTL
jgi:hypothetical protein